MRRYEQERIEIEHPPPISAANWKRTGESVITTSKTGIAQVAVGSRRSSPRKSACRARITRTLLGNLEDSEPVFGSLIGTGCGALQSALELDHGHCMLNRQRPNFDFELRGAANRICPAVFLERRETERCCLEE